jgi:hypothetical protein
MLAWGSAPGIRLSPDNQALKARLNPAWLLNPKRTAHRNQRRAREATRGILPETSACDGALVAPQCIAARHGADSGLPKTRRSHVASKSRDTEHQALFHFEDAFFICSMSCGWETVRGSVVTM